MSRTHLDHWASVYKDFAKLEKFLDWLNSQGVFLEYKDRKGPALNHNDLLNQYLKVDAVALDRERRALLVHHREMTGQTINGHPIPQPRTARPARHKHDREARLRTARKSRAQ
jgi:hypothetical protein